jgi:hypothetical protein
VPIADSDLSRGADTMRRLRLLAVALSFLASRADAQLTPTPESCTAAATAVAGQRLPAVDDSTNAAWYALSLCGSTGQAAFAQAVQTTAVISDTDEARLQVLFALFRDLRSSAIFTSLRTGIQSGQGSVAFERLAIRALGGMYRPGVDFDSASVNSTSGSFCGMTRRFAQTSGSLTDLPSDYLNQLLSTMQSVEAATAYPNDIRGAARCWRLLLERDVPPVGSKLLLTYMCNNRFRVRNSNTASAAVSADVYGTTEILRFTVQPREDFFIEMAHKGTVRLFFRGGLVQTKANGGKACT